MMGSAGVKEHGKGYLVFRGAAVFFFFGLVIFDFFDFFEN